MHSVDPIPAGSILFVEPSPARDGGKKAIRYTRDMCVLRALPLLRVSNSIPARRLLQSRADKSAYEKLVLELVISADLRRSSTREIEMLPRGECDLIVAAPCPANREIERVRARAPRVKIKKRGKTLRCPVTLRVAVFTLEIPLIFLHCDLHRGSCFLASRF